MFSDLSTIQKIAVWAIPVVFAITVHEVAHGWVALRFGDTTAKMMGRLTLNPVKHIDLVGTIIIPVLLLIFGGFIFGYARPVPVNQFNLRNPRWYMPLVALAGPFANLIMAFIWIGIFKIATLFPSLGVGILMPLSYVCQAGVIINLILMILNLIPIPPLDGSRVLAAFLPRRWLPYYDLLEPFGFIIIVVLLVGGVLGHVITPIFSWALNMMISLFGLY